MPVKRIWFPIAPSGIVGAGQRVMLGVGVSNVLSNLFNSYIRRFLWDTGAPK